MSLHAFETGDGTLDQIQRPIFSDPGYEQGLGDRGGLDYTSQNYAQNHLPILHQMKADMDTTAFIPEDQRQREINSLQESANEIIQQAHSDSQVSIKNLTLGQILTNTSDSFIGLSNDLFLKPQETPWNDYIGHILTKDSRYVYLGIIMIFIVMYIFLFRD